MDCLLIKNALKGFRELVILTQPYKIITVSIQHYMHIVREIALLPALHFRFILCKPLYKDPIGEHMRTIILGLPNHNSNTNFDTTKRNAQITPAS
jgi:hypothetical protein